MTIKVSSTKGRKPRSDKGKPRQRTGKTAAERISAVVDEDRRAPTPKEKPVLVTLAASEPEPELPGAPPPSVPPPQRRKARRAAAYRPPAVRLEWDARGGPVDQHAVTLVMRSESYHDRDKRTPNSDPVPCPTGVITAGWGHTLYDPETAERLRDDAGLARARELWPEGFTREQCEQWLREDLAECAAAVDRLVKVPINVHQRSALISFVYNLGTGEQTPLEGFDDSALLKKLNMGDYTGAAGEFGRWVYGRVKGVKTELPGLVKRRRQERELFLRSVVPEGKALLFTPEGKALAGGAAAAAGSTAVGTVAGAALDNPEATVGIWGQIANAVSPVLNGLANAGLPPLVLFGALAAGGLGWLIWLLVQRSRH